MARNPLNALDIATLLAVVSDEVPVAPGVLLKVRPLTLEEMVQLLVRNQAVFQTMYTSAMSASGDTLDLAPVLLSAPDMVSDIIAMASDQEDVTSASEVIRRQMAASVQLIALEKIWALSVPDPKKTFELLSGVMGRLKKHGQGNATLDSRTSPISSSPA